MWLVKQFSRAKEKFAETVIWNDWELALRTWIKAHRL